MKKLIFFTAVITLLALTQQVNAQDCKSAKDLETLPGKHIDAAHCEWPEQKAHWFDALGTAANKATANTILTKIETLEKQSRAKYNLKGCVLKTTFSGNTSTYPLASYDLNMGVYEYICVKNKMMVNTEYENVFRAYVNRYTGIENAFSFPDEAYYYETLKKYNGQFIPLHDFIKMDASKNINNGKGFYQDVAETTVKQGNRSVYMTRHWYFTKPGALLFVPVTRKEYLEALLVYYERERLLIADKIKEIETESAGMMKNPQKYPQLYEDGKKNLVVKKAKYPDWQQKIETKKAIVQKALKENTAVWLAQPAVVKPKVETFSWKRTYGSGPNDEVWIETRNVDTKEDAQKTGSFTFSGFWDNKGGTTLYKYNPDYFKGAEKNPAKPYMIELTYRYVKTPIGQSLVENFTENFDFDAVRNMLE
ncbi:hypothetical protein GM921_03175 [Pedobacter sp. LMG 31464]|uniref:Uncharacterized protein n=1 Tax=Pedobacter planticolens TaxID=2679964 RepID=A0A923DYX9_9SPHI|nr:hypothetical protein [Pedobacter planticolens]MBB2144472.1 hypothetical protein [Pedobacter planticolens]